MNASARNRSLIALAISAGILFLISLIPIDAERLAEQEARRLSEQLEVCHDPGSGLDVRADSGLDEIGVALERICASTSVKKTPPAVVRLEKHGNKLTVKEIDSPDAQAVTDKDTSASIAGAAWWALVPAVVAVALAIATRKLLLSLLLGVAAGAGLAGIDGTLTGPLIGFTGGTATVLYEVMTDDFHFWIFLFTFSLIGMVNVMNAGGGIDGVARLLVRIAGNSRSTQAATALLGCAVFFDDYSNSVVVGAAMRPLSDRARIAREKLAFLIDTTAAPIAGLAIVSTWIGYEIGLIGNGLTDIGLSDSPFSVFISALPYRFYCIFALVFVGLNIYSRREFGPMRKAVERARSSGDVLRPGSQPLAGATAPESKGQPSALAAIVPVASVVVFVLAGMVLNGAGVIDSGGVHLDKVSSFSWNHVWSVEENYITRSEDSGMILGLSSVAGSLLAIILGLTLCRAPLLWLVRAWFSAGRMLLIAFGVLILAWSMGHINGMLGTSAYVVSSLAGDTPVWALPGIVFLIAGGISFSTGSSWGTMAVLLPAVVPLAHHVGGMPMLIVTVGTVLDGSIFGDHCSPLSDTTVMASIASGCDHLDHVRTQMPYSLVIALAALACGYALIPLIPVVVSYGLAVILLAAIVWKFGQRVGE